MASIAKVEIANFRSIKSLSWCPQPGFNCLIAPGDRGKSSVLEAIAWCLSSNVNRLATDADFFQLDTSHPISVSLIITGLPDELMMLEPYGNFHCGFNATTGDVEDEPGNGLECALSVTLTIDQTMQGLWSLNSNRVEDENRRRRMAPRALRNLSRLQLQGDNAAELSFGRGSILYNLTPD